MCADYDAVAQSQLLVAWHQAGVSKRSLQQIVRQLEQNEYPLSYVRFVLARIGKQHQLGKVKKPAGAIYILAAGSTGAAVPARGA